MIQVKTFAGIGGLPRIAASSAAEQAQAWMEQEQVHPGEIVHISTDTNISEHPELQISTHTFTLTLVLYRLLPLLHLEVGKTRYVG